jgi:ethanolamine ammonia-lyase small subunit
MDNPIQIRKEIITTDAWLALRSFTQARIALGRTGISVPLKENLGFKLAHAHARDAVYAQMNNEALIDSLRQLDQPFFLLHSRTTGRDEYLQRPDFGRRLNEDSVHQLRSLQQPPTDVAFIIADGLSATAINQHAMPVLTLLLDKLKVANIQTTPICLVNQGRVAIADEIASLLHAQLSVILIGERPGLSSFDSMGAYITYSPRVGLTDESRNCISNIRPRGLGYEAAADKIFYLLSASLRLKISGVALKDNTGLLS